MKDNKLDYRVDLKIHATDLKYNNLYHDVHGDIVKLVAVIVKPNQT